MRHGLTNYQRNALNRMLREKINVREDYICQRCGFTGYLDPHHIYPQGTYPGMKYELRNLLGLCRPCHAWWHSNPKEARNLLKTLLTASERLFLHELSLRNDKVRFDFKKEKEKLKI
ncbi:MAG: HNH endonuclease [Candidatus Zixiibacteriota bacterium]